MKKKGGNVKREEEIPAPKEVIKEGDVVRLTDQALKSRFRLIPKLLHKMGWPNRFEVSAVWNHSTDGPCISIVPCCNFMKNHSTGKFHCAGHQMGFFEKVSSAEEAAREWSEDDRRASVTVPYLGELASYEYHAKEKEAIFKVGGQPVKVVGGFAEALHKMVQEQGIVG